MQQIVDAVPLVPFLDSPAPLTVEQLAEGLRFFDALTPVVAEQVIDMPKILFEDIPTRTPARSGSRSAAGGTVGGSANNPVFPPAEQLTFQHLVVVGVSQIFMVFSQYRDQQLLAVEVFKAFAQDRFQWRHPHFLTLPIWCA